MQSIEAVRETQARTLVLDFGPAPDTRKREQLAQLLTRFRGGECAVAVRVRAAGAQGLLLLDAAWNVRPTPQLMDDLERLCGSGAVRVSYTPPPREPGPGELRPASVVAVV